MLVLGTLLLLLALACASLTSGPILTVLVWCLKLESVCIGAEQDKRKSEGLQLASLGLSCGYALLHVLLVLLNLQGHGQGREGGPHEAGRAEAQGRRHETQVCAVCVCVCVCGVASWPHRSPVGSSSAGSKVLQLLPGASAFAELDLP